MSHVWYASYGSNLSLARFQKYLRGGSAHRATGRPERGARDASDPLDEMVITSHHDVFFAHASQKWDGGGVAFLEPSPSTEARRSPHAMTTCRAYKITVEQFEDVYQQENGAAEPVPLDIDELLASGQVVQHDALYGMALLLSVHVDGCPIVTITTSRRDLELNCPSVGYASTIASGLMECAGLSPDRAADYVLGLRGVDRTLKRAELIAAL